MSGSPTLAAISQSSPNLLALVLYMLPAIVCMCFVFLSSSFHRASCFSHFNLGLPCSLFCYSRLCKSAVLFSASCCSLPLQGFCVPWLAEDPNFFCVPQRCCRWFHSAHVPLFPICDSLFFVLFFFLLSGMKIAVL